ncbi:MAG: conjugal transfer protein TraX [Defluviitaleaceae bacterium]|nr:conjugal transfer protein TraX [Defluviitaleaceae bacterium]
MLKLDAYKLKWIAIFGMVLSHMIYAWWDIMPMWLVYPLSFVGGFTFPIMAFFVAEGYRHTSNLGKYIFRLFIFGVIATPFHILVIGLPWLNIMFAIILGLLVLMLYDKIKYRVLFWLLYAILIIPLSTLFFEWYFIGITMVLMYHIIRNETARRIVPPIFAGVCWLVLGALSIVSFTAMGMTSPEVVVTEGLFRNSGFLMNIYFMYALIPFGLGCFLVAFFLKNYNGERGKKMRWLFYAIYPLHFAVLAAIAFALGLIDINLMLGL